MTLPDGSSHEDLASTRSAHDLVAEVHARILEASNLGVEVGGDEVDAVPSARDLA